MVLDDAVVTFKAASAKGRVKYWLISACLISPALLPYFTHYFVKLDGQIPTGFIQYDQPYYLANAREHFDGDHFSWSYGNPFSSSYDSPRIYFQPQTLLWGGLLSLTGWNPGLIYVLTGLIAAVICIRVALSLYEEVVGVESWAKRLGFVMFCWGGGLLALAGIVYNLLTRQLQYSIFRFDPFEGWWFLNFGRNLIFPTEAIYHTLFLASVVCLLRKRFKLALALALILSFSHPFTGIELLAILAAWAFLEVALLRNREVPTYFLVSLAVLVVIHVGYYLFFLKLFPEHRALQSQWELDWILTIKNILPAYALVGSFALWSILRERGPGKFFQSSRNRFLFTWFLVAFLLANHELFMRPIQPLHFTRGYIWMPLFLMGAGSLAALFSHLASRKNVSLKLASITLIACVFLSDNALWLGSFPYRGWYGIRLSRDEKQLLDWFALEENKGSLVASEDNMIGYYSNVYSPLHAWTSHYSNTPFFNQRQEEVKNLFQHGTYLEQWKTLQLLIVSPSTKPFATDSLASSGKEITTPFQNSSFTVLRVSSGTVR